MISVPLQDVVAFLRPRGALGILEGAPFVGLSGDLHATRLPEDLGKRYARLYLGNGEICPAAEGWAARVLGIARASSMPVMIQDCRSFLCIWQVPLTSAVPYATWQWVEQDVGDDGEWTRIGGAPPATPAERLAAVLRYELGRAP